MELTDEIARLLQSMDMGYMPGVAYDTAWIARLIPKGYSEFSSSLDWLLAAQKEDGSFGGQAENYHDRVISTLSSIIALSEQKGRYEEIIVEGESYLKREGKKIVEEKYDTIGFELLFPSLMEEGRGLNMDLPYPLVKKFNKIKEHKLRLIPPELIYSNQTTLAFSAEFLGILLDPTRVEKMQNFNGSLGNSPSATAFMLTKTANVKGVEYLKKVLSLNPEGGVMSVYPFEIFEKSWGLFNLAVFGSLIKNDSLIDIHKKYLEEAWTTKGVSISTTSGVIDSDDTAVTFKVLNFLKSSPDMSVFRHYERDDHFACFDFERDPSMSANVHILDALADLPSFTGQDEMIEKVLKFLKGSRSDTYWLDKWHISPYYITSHAVMAISKVDENMAYKSVDWILNTQHDNGSWGYCNGNPEETSYALQALMKYYEDVEILDSETLRRGIEYLLRKEKKFPELWVSKALYCPINVVKSAILGVLYKYKNMGGEFLSGR